MKEPNLSLKVTPLNV